MERRGNTLDLLFRFMIITCSIIAIGSIAIYHFTPAKDSDYVEGVIWAKETLESGKLLNPDFIYPYAIPFGANLFMLPFVKLFGISQMANSFGMILFFGVLLTTLLYFVRCFTHRFSYSILGIAIILMAYRSTVGENQLHHILYYQLGFICFLGISAAVIRCIFQDKKTINVICVLLYSLWGGMNGISTIALANIPILVSLFISLFTSKLIEKNKRKLYCLLYLLIGTVVGFAIYFVSMRNVAESSYVEESGSFTFKGIDIWIDNLRSLPETWFKFFVNSPENKKITEFAGLEVLLSICIAIVIGGIPFCFIRCKKQSTEKAIIVYYAVIVVWLVCLMQYVLLRGAEDRLLYNGVMVNCVLLSIIVVEKQKQESTKIAKVFYSIAIIFFAVYFVLFPVNAIWKTDTTITDTLIQRGLRYGFGSYWNANYHTVNSGDRVKIRPIELVEGKIRQLKYQSSDLWYDSQAIQEHEQWFLLLDNNEWQKMIQAMNIAPLELSNEVIEINDYHILIFDAKYWNDIIFSQHIIYYFASDVWQKQCETKNDKRMINDGGISYGPYIPVTSGKAIHVKISGDYLVHAGIEVYEGGKHIDLQPTNFTNTNNEISFDLLVNEDMEKLEVLISNPENDNYTQPIELVAEEIIVQ